MKLKTIYESTVYREFLDLRGPAKSVFNQVPRTKKEIKEWDERQKNFKDVYDILKHLRSNLYRATNRGSASHAVEVDLDYVYEIGASQDFLCAMTGQEMEFTRGGEVWMGQWCNPNSCTIDRIDSSKGYIEDNIQLVTWRANCLKRNIDNSEFIEFCKDVAYWNK